MTGSPHPWPRDAAFLPWVHRTPESAVVHLSGSPCGDDTLCGRVLRSPSTTSWLPVGTRICSRCLAWMDRHIEDLHVLRDALADGPREAT